MVKAKGRTYTYGKGQTQCKERRYKGSINKRKDTVFMVGGIPLERKHPPPGMKKHFFGVVNKKDKENSKEDEGYEGGSLSEDRKKPSFLKGAFYSKTLVHSFASLALFSGKPGCPVPLKQVQTDKPIANAERDTLNILNHFKAF